MYIIIQSGEIIIEIVTTYIYYIQGLNLEHLLKTEIYHVNMMLECNLSYHLGHLLAGVSQRTYF